MDSLRGRLLVATPAIEDGVFARSVVYLLDHDGAGEAGDGALGVIVNRPLDADVGDVLPDWYGLVAAPGCLFQGGPVATDSALAVGVLPDTADGAAADGPPAGWQPMAGRIGLVDLDVPPQAGRLQAVRVFAGYAGWSGGQLEAEIAEGAWLVIDAELADLVSPRPETLWSDVLRRQAGDLRLWATLPADPRQN